ncbi:hypothetical protein D9M68_805510 [compost metagenome]
MKAPTPITKIARLKLSARRRDKKPMAPPPSLPLRALAKLSRCRVLSMSPMVTISPLVYEVIR